jgi:putative membrane protein
MKNATKQNSFPHGHRAIIASAMIMLVGAATAAAQSGGAAGSTSSGSSQKNPPTDTSSTTGSTYGTGKTDTTGRATTSGSTYGSGSQTGTTATGGTYGSERAATSSSSTMTGSARLSWSDRRFVTKAADGGHDEIQLAQLAAQRATNAEVRSFAQKLVDDHTKVNSELMTIASQKNVKVDKDDDKDRAYKRLSKKTGSEFDQEFVEHMIDEHEKDIKQFEKAASDAKDADVRAFASKHVADLRSHLQQAQGLRQSLMPTGRMDDSSGRSTPGGPTTSDTSTSTTTPSSTSTSTSGSDTTTTKRNR